MAEGFRNYVDSSVHDRVSGLYLIQHTKQTFASNQALRNKHLKFDKCKKSIFEMMDYLDNFVDESDPDTSNAQVFHAYQV